MFSGSWDFGLGPSEEASSLPAQTEQGAELFVVSVSFYSEELDVRSREEFHLEPKIEMNGELGDTRPENSGGTSS